MGGSFRFRPPRVTISPEVSWLLRRAFGPTEARLPIPPNPDNVLTAGARLDVVARIASRTPAPVLAAELGESIAGTFHEWFEATAVQQNSLRHVIRDIDELARDLGTPVVFLKGMVLVLTGLSAPGSRPMGDIDLLVPPAAALSFQEALIRRGWTGITGSDQPIPMHHHLPPLVDPNGRIVELHTRISRVRTEEGADFTAGELLRRRLVRPVDGLSNRCMVPSPDLFVAHLLVHSIDQHALRPHSYAQCRILTDLLDVGLDRAGLKEFFDGGAHRWIEDQANQREVTALVTTAQRLQAGEEPTDMLAGEDDASKLLGHLVAVAQDRKDYVWLLTWRDYRARGVASNLRRFVQRLFPSNDAVRAQLGFSAGTSDLVVWHLRRPFRVGKRVAHRNLQALADWTRSRFE